MPPDTISVLEKKLEGLEIDDYELYIHEKHHRVVEAKEGEIDGVDQSTEKGAAIRLFKGEHQGFASTSDLTPPFLDRMVELAYNIMFITEKGERLHLPSETEKSTGSEGSFELGAVAKSHQMAIDVEKFAKSYDRRVSRVREASFGEEVRSVWIQNSKGLKRHYSKGLCELSLLVVAEEGSDQEMAWESEFAETADRLNVRELAEKVAQKALSQLGAKPIETQKSKALLDPSVVTSFLGILSSSFFADQVQRSRSALKGRLGEKV